MNPHSLKHLLEGGNAFMHANHVLSGLEPESAVRVFPHAVHSIAAHVAHMAWWQRQVIHDLETRSSDRIRIPGEEFPEDISLERWEAIRQDFLGGLERLKGFCDDPALLEQPYLNRDSSVLETLLDFALHNAYHLGQIVLLRRLLGAWPPAAG